MEYIKPIKQISKQIYTMFTFLDVFKSYINVEDYYTFCTDNHGFKYKCGFNRNKEFDIAFIGDSFVEGVSLNYEKTFVGIFEKSYVSGSHIRSTSNPSAFKHLFSCVFAISSLVITG